MKSGRVVPQRCECMARLPVHGHEGKSHTCSCGAKWEAFTREDRLAWRRSIGFDPLEPLGTVFRVEGSGRVLIELNANGLKALSEGRLVSADKGRPPRLFGDIPVIPSAGVPDGCVLALSQPDERQKQGLDKYPRDDQWAFSRLNDEQGEQNGQGEEDGGEPGVGVDGPARGN